MFYKGLCFKDKKSSLIDKVPPFCFFLGRLSVGLLVSWNFDFLKGPNLLLHEETRASEE